MASLKDGDIIALSTEGDAAGVVGGYLSTDRSSLCGTTSDRLLVADSPFLPSSKERLYPPQYENRCLFRVCTARGGTIASAALGSRIMSYPLPARRVSSATGSGYCSQIRAWVMSPTR